MERSHLREQYSLLIVKFRIYKYELKYIQSTVLKISFFASKNPSSHINLALSCRRFCNYLFNFQIAVPAVVENTQGARVELDVCIECATTLVVPLNQFSTQSILLEATSLVMKNTFENLSEVGELFKQYSVTTEYGFGKTVPFKLGYVYT